MASITKGYVFEIQTSKEFKEEYFSETLLGCYDKFKKYCKEHNIKFVLSLHESTLTTVIKKSEGRNLTVPLPIGYLSDDRESCISLSSVVV